MESVCFTVLGDLVIVRQPRRERAVDWARPKQELLNSLYEGERGIASGNDKIEAGEIIGAEVAVNKRPALFGRLLIILPPGHERRFELLAVHRFEGRIGRGRRGSADRARHR